MSDWRNQGAVTLVIGLLLAGLPSQVLAAGKQHAHRPPTHRQLHSESGDIAELTSTTNGLSGSASFYGHRFTGRKTSAGERFDTRLFTAASNHFPLGSLVSVQRLDNARCAIVKINDRMGNHRRRIIDVSRGVAEYLGMIREGVVLVRVAPLKGDERTPSGCQAAFAHDDDCPDCVDALLTGEPPRAPSLNWREPSLP